MEENKMRRFTEEIAKFADKPFHVYFATSNANKFKEMQFLGRQTFSVCIFKCFYFEITVTFTDGTTFT